MDKIIEIKKKIASSSGTELTEYRLDLAFATRIKDPQQSSSEALKAYEEACLSGNHKQELRAIFLICTSSLYNEDFTDRKKWLTLLESRARELESNTFIGRANIIRSRFSTREGNQIEAAEYLIEALTHFDPVAGIKDIVSCYNGLGNIYNELSDFDKALEYYKKAMPYARKLGNRVHNLIKQNIALILTMKKQFAPAWKIYDHILDNLSSDETETKRVICLNLGHICQKTEEREQALEYFDEAIELSKTGFPSHYMIRPMCNKALILTELGRYDESLLLLKEAEEIAEESDNDYDLLEVYYRYSDVYEYNDKPKEQVAFLKKIIKMEKQIYDKASKSKIRAFEDSLHDRSS